MTRMEKLVRLDEILGSLGEVQCEEIELSHQVESMNERITQLNKQRNGGDALIKVVDKRRHTRERLTEVRIERQELETEKERLKAELEYGYD